MTVIMIGEGGRAFLTFHHSTCHSLSLILPRAVVLIITLSTLAYLFKSLTRAYLIIIDTLAQIRKNYRANSQKLSCKFAKTVILHLFYGIFSEIIDVTSRFAICLETKLHVAEGAP